MAKMLLPDSSPVTPPSVPARVLFDGTRWSKAAVCGALLTASLYQAVHAAPGDLDPSFDADGKVLTDFRPRSRSHETASAVVVQPDGKVAAAGRPGFLLARYHPDGSLDRSFGRGGRVETGFGVSSVNALALQPDAKLVAAGRAGAGDGTSSDFALVRYDPNGRLDTSFDGGGRVLTTFGAFASANALVVQPDGKLVAAGRAGASDGSSGDFALARYHVDGSLDTSFDGDGLVLTGFGGSASVNALVLQSDGKLVVAGELRASDGSREDFALARYHLDGSLDTSFDGNGRMLTTFGAFASANALVVQPDGKLVAAGRAGASNGSSGDFALARYHPDGSLDASFDGDGLVLTDIATLESASALVLQTDGKLVALGTSVGHFALVRYRPDGSLDTDFGANGRVVTTFGASEFANALALQPDGRLVAAGGSNTAGDRDFALARYLITNEQPPLPSRCGGVSATTLGTAGNDALRGTRLMDVILGSAGNDTIRGLGGNDILCGGPGRDVLMGEDGDDKLFGGPGRDILMGKDGGDKLFGGRGKDQLFGAKGRDRLDGGSGNDDCNGGPGRDTIISC